MYLTVIPPNCDPDGDEAEETQPGKQPCCHRCRNSYIEQPETDKKRQEQHCHSNEIQIFIIGRRVLKFLTNHSTFIWKKLLLYCILNNRFTGSSSRKMYRRLMKDELTKIAEITFKQFVAKYTWFADVGTELRNIQQELGDIAGRTKSIEKILGISPYKDRVPSLAGASSVLTSQTEIQHITGEEIKQIRLKKKLSITQMAYLLNVSVRKYRDWELGHILVAPCIEEEILKIRDRKYRELHATLQQVGVGTYPEPKLRRQTRIHPPPEPPIKTFSGTEIHEVCDALNLSQRELSNLLGIKKHNVEAWIRCGIHPKNPVIEKFMKLREKAMAIPPEERAKMPKRSFSIPCTYDYVKPEEIAEILARTHWTMRELGVYLGGVSFSLIWTWKKGRSKPSEELSLKLRELQRKLQTGEIKPEHSGEFVSVEEFQHLFKKMNWTANRLSKTLHISTKRVQGWLRGNGTPNYADTVKIRNFQRKIQRGEVIPPLLCRHSQVQY